MFDRKHTTFADIEKAVQALEKQLYDSAPTARERMEDLKRVIHQYKMDNMDDGK